MIRVGVLFVLAALAVGAIVGCPSHDDGPACDGWPPSAEPARTATPPILALTLPPPLANDPAPPSVVRVDAPVKLFQLIGDLDRETTPPKPTPLQTETRYGLVGTDLGYPVIHKQRLYLFFGDAEPRKPFDAARRTPDADVIGFIELGAQMPAPTPAGGVDLQFFVDTDGQYLPARLDGQTLGGDEVTYAGFSDQNRLYGVFAVGAAPGRSIVGVSDDDGRTFSTYVNVPTDRLGFIAPKVVPTSQIGGLTWSDPSTVLMWARPRQQEGEPLFLAAAPLGSFADLTTWRYFAGGTTWSAAVADAPGIFTRPADEQCLGPFSVDYIPGLEKWLIIERCRPHHFAFRVASNVLGPWSAPQVLYDRDDDGGLCHYMHKLCDPSSKDASAACCDSDYQPEIYCKFGPDEGDVRPYGPGVLTPYGTFDSATKTATIYFLMSVNNPYSPMVMRGNLRLQ